ncbi:MAG: M20 family metallo-hydrolase [Treponema sp.]|nr:M20 family metallo-hydrolase [Treponema sp.]
MKQFDTVKKSIHSDIRKMIELQTLLSSIPAIAPDSGGEGELKKCEALTEFLRKNGFSGVEFQRFDATDSRVPSGIRPNLVVTVPGKKDDFSIWIMAHMDVVPPGDLSLWKTDPWNVVEKDGKLFGRGVEDNQQGLVSSVLAAKSFLDNGILPEHTVKLLFVADEEFGSTYGIKFLLREHRNLFGKNDLIIIPDGGDSSGEAIEVAEKNILWMRLRTMGVQSHGSMPDKGKNAHLAACDLSLRLNDLENVFNEKDESFVPPYSTFQPTKKEANVESVNIIPGDDVFFMDCRILPRYTLKEVRARVDERVRAVEEKYGVKIQVTEVQHEESPATPADAPVVKRLAAAIKEAHGITARTIGIGGGTVGALFRQLGYNVAIWSTLDEVCHQPNEYCIIENIEKDAMTLAALFFQE